MKNKEKLIQALKDRIDDYNNTVYAIIGFMNTYKYELSGEKTSIVFFQGRKLFLSQTQENYVTPDLGLCIGKDQGVVGEVKYSFPADKSLWKDDFIQLKKYDAIQTGWPTESKTVKTYDIVLLVQQSRSRVVKDYYTGELEKDLKLNRQFAIIEFNRSSQGKEYFHFRIEHGKLSNETIQKKFYNGLYISMQTLLKSYAKIKIYDTEPPLPLMLNYIYECVADKLHAEGRYKKVNKKTVIESQISSNEITKKLNEVYSFKSIHSKKHIEHQPEFPKQEWVRRAFDHLALIGEGMWTNKKLDRFIYFLTYKDGDILDHYIKKSINAEAVQQRLF